MFFKRKHKELESEEIEQIIEEYSEVVKETISKYLPRRERRAMSKGRGGMGLTPSTKKEEIEQIKKKGISVWLNGSTEDALNELSPIVSDFSSLESDLRGRLKEFKRKWKIK